MENRMLDKQMLISKILEIELHMFLTAPTQEKSSCQNYPESFKMHRHAQFFPWSKDTINLIYVNINNPNYIIRKKL